MEREQKRLAKLEEEAATQRQPVPVGRRWPSDHEEDRALDQGMDAWFALMRSHGWTDQEIDEELEWTKTLHERCFEAGFEDWEIVADMCAFVDSLELPLSEVKAAFDDYPGPGYWGRGSANGPMPVQ